MERRALFVAPLSTSPICDEPTDGYTDKRMNGRTNERTNKGRGSRGVRVGDRGPLRYPRDAHVQEDSGNRPRQLKDRENALCRAHSGTRITRRDGGCGSGGGFRLEEERAVIEVCSREGTCSGLVLSDPWGTTFSHVGFDAFCRWWGRRTSWWRPSFSSRSRRRGS